MKASTLCAIALPWVVAAQTLSSCTALRPSGSIKPSVASGYNLQVVATGLNRPRGLALDTAGNLLVVQAGNGSLTAHTITDNNGCVTLGFGKTVSAGLSLNHGIQLSSDGKTLFASSVESVYQFSYNAALKSAANRATIINSMSNSDHSTRTLQISQKVPGTLLVSRGSTSNLDYGASNLVTGRSQIKAFDLNARGTRIYNFTTDGKRLGWGLRNSVGVAEHPSTGGIWSVENSADNIVRYGQQVNQNNPGEELNYHGTLINNTFSQQGGNYGYPWCFSAWAVNELPQNSALTVGKQFALSQSSDLNNENRTDAYCASQIPPRITFQAHMAPLDIKFTPAGDQAWVSFHGSWDRSVPIGYKVSVLKFANGQPTESSTSTTAVIDIVKNVNDSVCPDNCLRPAGLVIDSKGRTYFSSDASGEVYLITKSS